MMARTVINNRCSQLVDVSVTEAVAGKSIGSTKAYYDPRTGVTKFEWVCKDVSINDMNFVTLGSAGYSPEAELFSRINFSISGMITNYMTIDGQIFFPKVVLRNPEGLSFNGVLLNGFLQLNILSNATKAPARMIYSIGIEAVFTPI